MQLDLCELKKIIPKWAESFSTKQVVLLCGDLGAGKTQLVKLFGEHWGEESFHSPTFSIINEYHTKMGPVVHVDLYRLNSLADVESTGFWDIFLKPKAVVFIEWPERLETDPKFFGWSVIQINIQKISESVRDFEFVLK